MGNSITIKGVKHVLVADTKKKEGCKPCSLKVVCYQTSDALCSIIFSDENKHFETEK